MTEVEPLLAAAPDRPKPRRALLLSLDPDLGEHLDPDDREAAGRAAAVPAVDVPSGPFEVGEIIAHGVHPFGAMVASGLVSREVCAMGQPALRLFGPGEMFCAQAQALDGVHPETRWVAATETRLAILDDHLLLAIRRWPRLVRALFTRLEQSHATTLSQLAISHQPRVEDRIVALMRVLAARWGRVTPDGVALGVPLTHEAIGRMIGARRPTVTLALGTLRDKELVVRLQDGRWLLREPAGAKAELRPVPTTQLPRLVSDGSGDLGA